MNRKQWLCVLFTALLVLSPSIRADDSKVAAWAKQVIISTLTVDYRESDKDVDKMQVNYTLNAWDGVSTFLGPYLGRVRREQLSLHPVAENPPTIAYSGKISAENLFPSMPYWRIELPVYIPELNVHITFSVLVIAVNAERPRYLIQSIDMTKQNGR